ncbi:MAG: hypothetical protein LH650_09085 [Chloroflexi bacterium]|nr:hypothetical protein [Chloroflexota bacterium]
MAQQALPAGAVRRRAVFGLFDADGWSWAGIKATFWFMVFVFLLAYVPNLAYYFTVSNTVQVGYSVLSPINWCPSTNESLPCPAPAGAVVPWQTSPIELSLPAAVSGAVVAQSGVHIYLVGGTTAAGATADVFTTQVGEDGNFVRWVAGPALPEPRTDAAVVSLTGVPYVIGGLDAAGNATSTVFMATVANGEVTGWVLADGTNSTQDLTLPTPLSGTSVVPTSNGLYLFGGQTPDGLSATILHSALLTGALQPWTAITQLPLPEPRANATAIALGDTLYVFGGTGLAGPTTTIYRLSLADGLPATTEDGRLIGWASAPTSQQLPSPRSGAASFNANGSIYVIGGVDASGAPQGSTLWAVPNTTTGDLPAWHSLDQTDLPEGRSEAGIAAIGSFAYVVAGDGPAGALDTVARANISPLPPFFQLGILGATIPALSIKGEIGQQLGYLNAMGVGMTNFILLVLLGYWLTRRDASMRLLERLSRGKIKAPRDDEYLPGT